MKGLTVGETVAYNYGKEFNEAKAAGIIHVESAPDDETNLKKLLDGKIDVFPGGLMVTNAQMRDTFTAEEVKRLTHNPKAIAEEPLFLILSKRVPGNEQMRDRFNKGFKMLKESGKYDQILADGLAGKYDTK